MVARPLQVAPTPPPTADSAIPAADETAAQSRAIDAFASNLTVAPIRNSRLVDLQISSCPMPRWRRSIVNALAKNYIEQSLEFKFMASKEASDWLGQRLGEQRKQLEESETKLQQYREQNDAISLKDRENIVVQKLSDLNGAVTQAKTERFQKEALYRQLESLRGNSAMLDTFPAILTNTFIQQQKTELAQLQSQYAQMGDKLGERHPDMVKLRSAIQVDPGQARRRDRQGRAGRQERLPGRAGEGEQPGGGAERAEGRRAGDEPQGDRLQRARPRSAERPAALRQPAAAGQGNRRQHGAEDQQHPDRRSGRAAAQAGRARRRASTCCSPLFGGSLAACGLVFFFEYLDSRIKTPDEIRIHLGLPHLGLLPALDGKALAASYPLVSKGVPGNFAEAFRAVRTNVLFSSAQEGSRSIVVTSTGPGEGKSMVASNLAISLAQAGQRTLLIDADMRKPKAHEIFEHAAGAGPVEPAGRQRQGERSVRKSGVAGLWVIPSGRMPPNPAELLGSQRFRDFLGVAEGPLRLGDHRLAAGDGGDRRGAGGAPRHRRGVRRRRGDDQPARGEDRGRPAAPGPREIRRRRAQPRRSRAERLLLLAVLPPGIQRLLPEDALLPYEPPLPARFPSSRA